MASPEIATLRQAPDRLYIDGEWVAARSGATLDTYNPVTGQVLASVAEEVPA